MSQDYFKFLQPSQNSGVQGQNGVQGANGTRKVNGQEKTGVQKRYQFFTGFNNGANTGSGDNVQANTAIKAAEKLLSSISDETIKAKLKGSIDNLKGLITPDAAEEDIQAALKELKDITAQTTSIKPSMGLC